MKRWKCTVCGYIHVGEEPPEKCPVCGVPKNKFIEITESGEPVTRKQTPEAETSQPTPATKPATPPEPGSPPGKRSEPGAAAGPIAPQPESPFKDSRYRKLFETMTQLHGHPISVHIPNGLLPVCVLFIILAAIFNIKGMATAATYNLGVVALSMPLVLFSGWVDWQNRFNGAITNVFTVKIACGIVVSVTSWFLFIWLLVNPEVITTPQSSRVAFFGINLIMLAAASIAGWYGGKLVFRE
jgi:rubredoxin/uncharacterized membrane protein